jgi:hypothetical protein
MISDADLLNWLEDAVVDTIYMDDGTIIDVRGGSIREALLRAYKKAHQEPE